MRPDKDGSDEGSTAESSAVLAVMITPDELKAMKTSVKSLMPLLTHQPRLFVLVNKLILLSQ